MSNYQALIILGIIAMCAGCTASPTRQVSQKTHLMMANAYEREGKPLTQEMKDARKNQKRIEAEKAESERYMRQSFEDGISVEKYRFSRDLYEAKSHSY